MRSEGLCRNRNNSTKVEPVVLEGRVVRLEPLAAKHADGLAKVATPELFVHHFPPAELTAQGFRDQIAGLAAMPGWCPFAIVLRRDGKAVGISCYLEIRPEHRALEIGFTWIAKPWQGTDVNPEA